MTTKIAINEITELRALIEKADDILLIAGMRLIDLDAEELTEHIYNARKELESIDFVLGTGETK